MRYRNSPSVRLFALFLFAMVAVPVRLLGQTETVRSGLGTGGVDSREARLSCAGESDAHDALDVFWTTLDRRYATFGLRLPGEDWRPLGERACSEITDETTDNELFDILIDLARSLDDGHVFIAAPSLGRFEDGWVSEYPYYPEMYVLEFNVQDRYLDGPWTWAANFWFGWGRIGKLGYLSITAMEGLSDAGTEQADVRAADRAMFRALRDLRDTDGLIVDVRANEGGFDAVSLAVSRWLRGERALAWSKQRRNGPEHDDLSGSKELYVEGCRPLCYDAPVVLLTSGGTFSAGDTFVLAMRERDNVTVLGEPSSGHFSDNYFTQLPNGWFVSYSGELYTAADGNVYEGVGAPVDLFEPFNPDALHEERQDTMLEAAIAFLGEQGGQ